ncbi:uncharacterized protein MONBRDRAFT_27620 [Monosiga brevicollis MX1]|uniref:Rho-GAP domain-containing protein n=1 Tax=Monosiga brevicollis TaxID=81824 RepID=A9V5T9_MONBE|nr:uncharacterized protein MONBRDRAFT_27620 [Monosiga brevicollis MX1]EDQ87173.1 predicted protein [Monosiga brevicollis MX1]|eukprot:XP_001748116.1 hypothetical protein [Monosiga brevicollis MX1]
MAEPAGPAPVAPPRRRKIHNASIDNADSTDTSSTASTADTTDSTAPTHTIVLRSRVITDVDNQGLVEAQLDTHTPSAIRDCLAYLSTPRALREEGLFRIPGDQRHVRRLYELFEQGEPLRLDEILEPAIVCGLLKLLLKELKLPVDGTTQRRLLKAVDQSTGPSQSLRRCRKTVAVLSPFRFGMLQALVLLLRRIIATPGNLMTAANLTTAVGPTLFPQLPIQKTGLVLEYLVVYYPDIFTREIVELVHANSTRPADQAQRLSGAFSDDNPDPEVGAPGPSSLSNAGSGSGLAKLHNLLETLETKRKVAAAPAPAPAPVSSGPAPVMAPASVDHGDEDSVPAPTDPTVTTLYSF